MPCHCDTVDTVQYGADKLAIATAISTFYYYGKSCATVETDWHQCCDSKSHCDKFSAVDGTSSYSNVTIQPGSGFRITEAREEVKVEKWKHAQSKLRNSACTKTKVSCRQHCNEIRYYTGSSKGGCWKFKKNEQGLLSTFELLVEKVGW